MTYQPRRERDAWAAIRGYVYQVQLTIDRWLRLGKGQALELERGEDIDVISGWTADGTGNEQRLLEQIKHLDGSITLNSPDVRTALANFVEHRTHNAGEDLRFRLVTTARIGCEGNKGTRFIEAWEAIRAGRAAGKGCLRTLAGIRSILRKGGKPRGLLQETWDSYQAYLGAARGPEILSLILAFEWSTGQKQPEDLRIGIETALRESGWAADEVQAKEQYEALFVRVFHGLSIRGIKRLTAADRDGVLAWPALSVTDRRVFESLEVVMARLEKLEATVGEHDEAIEQLQIDQSAMQYEQRAIVASLAEAHGFRSAISTIELPPDLGLPPGASARATRATTVASILGILRSRTWLGIYGTSGSGKTELALLVAQATGANGHWLSLRDSRAAEALAHLNAALCLLAGRPPGPDRGSWDDALCAQLGPDHVLVLDDLPQFEADSPLGLQLAQLAYAFGRHGLKLLTTAALAIPSRMCARLGDTMVESIPAPSFTDDEAVELFCQHGAPLEWQDPSRATFINVITHGHAELIVTAAVFLKQHNWRFSQEELDRLLQGEYASSVEQDALRRLLTTVPDEATQQLLFRATLFKKSFTVDDLKVIAEVGPPVTSPRVRLTALEGIWLQREFGDHFRVCPLVKTFGTELSKTTWRAVHDAMGLLLMHHRRISLIELRHAIDHFMAAEEYARAGTALLLAMQEFHSKGVPEYDAGLTEIWADAPLPPSMDLGMRIYLRVQQAALRKKAGHPVQWLLEDLATLTEQVTDAHSSAFLTLLPHVVLLAAHNFARCSKYLRRAIEVQFCAVMPNGKPLKLSSDNAVEHFVWHQSACIGSEADLRDWMQTLRSLTSDQLGRLVRDDHRYEIFSVTLTEQFSRLEAEMPGRLGGWTKVDEALLDLAKLGEELGMDLLWAAAHRERIIIRNNHLKQVDEAIALAESVLMTSGQLRPACQVLILECVGCICVETNRLDQARRFLKRAMDLPTKSYALLRVQALIYASRAVEPDMNLAFQYLDEAIDLVQRTSWIPRITLTEAMGERALLIWTARGLPDAVAAMSDALECLLACKPEGDTYKELAVIFGNTTSYFLQLAGGKTPVGHNNEPLPLLRRGVFLSRNRARLQDYNPVRVATMPIVMVMLADMTSHDELVIRWARRGVKGAEETGQLGLLARVQYYVAADMIRRDDYSAAFRVSFAAVARTMAGGFSMQAGGKSMLDSGLDVDAVLGSRSSHRWREVEVVVLRILVLPAVFRIADVWRDDQTLGTNLAARLARECHEVGRTSAHPALWQMVSEIAEASFGIRESAHVLERTVNDDSVHEIVRIIARVGRSAQSGRSCVEAFGDQLATISYILSGDGNGFAFRQLVTPFVTHYWVNMVQQQPFRFVAPPLAREEILSASREPLSRQAKAVLRAAMFGLGIKGVSPDVHAWFRKPS